MCSRIYGKWLTTEFKKLTEEDQLEFYSKGLNGKKKIEQYLYEKFESMKRIYETAESGGGYYPATWYEKQGICTAQHLLDTCKDFKVHPVLKCKVFKVEFDKSAHGQEDFTRQTERMHKRTEKRLRRTPTNSSTSSGTSRTSGGTSASSSSGGRTSKTNCRHGRHGFKKRRKEKKDKKEKKDRKAKKEEKEKESDEENEKKKLRKEREAAKEKQRQEQKAKSDQAKKDAQEKAAKEQAVRKTKVECGKILGRIAASLATLQMQCKDPELKKVSLWLQKAGAEKLKDTYMPHLLYTLDHTCGFQRN
jgi:flagellar biosynthesis GTPase FlhF